MKKETKKDNKQIVEVHIYIHQVNPISWNPTVPPVPMPNTTPAPFYPWPITTC